MPEWKRGMINLGDILRKSIGGKKAKKEMTVSRSPWDATDPESNKMIEQIIKEDKKSSAEKTG